MKYLKYLLSLVVAANLIGHAAQIHLLTALSKPLLMPLLALSVFLAAKEKGIRGRRIRTIVLALLFGAVGDIFLMFHGTSWFLAGMLAFLVGHVFYFSTLPAPWKTKGVTGTVLSVLLLVSLLGAMVMTAGKFRVGGAMGACIAAYSCAFAFLIHGSVVGALDRKKPLYLLTALGFMLFAISDAFVAIGVFTSLEIPYRGLIVMSTYILAQMVVSTSLLAEEVHEWNRTEYGVRVKRLYALWDALKAHEDDFYAAFEKDLGKGAFETYTTEVGYLYNDIRHTIGHLRDWMEPEAARTPLVLWPGKSRIFPEPYGKVLVIGPFNYPLHLAIAPLTAALAAGNTAAVKPSRQTPNVSALISRMLSGCFDKDVVEVIGNDVPNDELLSRRFDYIFFTGSPGVGKVVMEAASKHLTPVTLELGGKSPAIVCESAHVRLACERIAKGKFLNAGQTCVAPDYVLVHSSIHDAFIAGMAEVIKEYFGDTSVRPSGMTLMASRKHFERVSNLIPARSGTASGSAAQPSDMAVPPSSPASQMPAMAPQPSGTASQPSDAALQPSGTVLQPSDVALQPSGTVLQPSYAALQPSGTVLQPSDAALQPSGTVLQPSDAALQPSGTASLTSARIAMGGYIDPATNYIAPTVLDNCSWSDPAMQEEIFGPVLPVIVFNDLQTEAIDKVRAGEKPLSLYIFTRRRSDVRAVLSQVSFGGGCVNETVMHLGNGNLPFGGVGNSGLGAYHGRTGFDTFSHRKSILYKSSWFNFDLLKPPYGNKLKLVRKVYR